jgi:hypothetical protein
MSTFRGDPFCPGGAFDDYKNLILVGTGKLAEPWELLSSER